MPVAVRLSERPVWAAYPVFRPPPAILLCIRQVAVAYDPYSAVQSSVSPFSVSPFREGWEASVYTEWANSWDS